jgi:hypothetical protein
MVEDTRPPIDYMQRTKDYYLGLGYGNPYQWACFDEVPFTKPVKKLSEMRIAIVTTAAPYQPDKGDQGPSAPYNAAAKFFSVYRLPIEPKPDLRISHIAIDRVHTSAKDSATFLPLAALKARPTPWQVKAVSHPIFMDFRPIVLNALIWT